MKKNPKQKIIVILVGIVIILSIAGTIFGISYIKDNYIKPVYSNNSIKKIRIPSFDRIKNETSLKSSPNGNINFLLLGISGENYISGNLADTIILASMNKNSNKATIFSFPRDFWVSDNGEPSNETNSGTWQKINELYKIEGGTEKPNIDAIGSMKKKIQDISGQEVHYSAIISLSGIGQIVDILSGVDTEEGFVDGKKALDYIRDRSRQGGDFDRMKRQQKLIVGILEKIKKGELLFGESQTLELLNLFEKEFSTDLSILQIFQLNTLLSNLNIKNIGMYTITPQTNLIYSAYTDVNGQQIYTLHPSAGKEEYGEIQLFITEKLNN